MAHILFWSKMMSPLRKFLALALTRAGHDVIDYGDGQKKPGRSCGKPLRSAPHRHRDAGYGRHRTGQARRPKRTAAMKISCSSPALPPVALHPGVPTAPKTGQGPSKPFHLREIVAEVERMMAA